MENPQQNIDTIKNDNQPQSQQQSQWQKQKDDAKNIMDKKKQQKEAQQKILQDILQQIGLGINENELNEEEKKVLQAYKKEQKKLEQQKKIAESKKEFLEKQASQKESIDKSHQTQLDQGDRDKHKNQGDNSDKNKSNSIKNNKNKNSLPIQEGQQVSQGSEKLEGQEDNQDKQCNQKETGENVSDQSKSVTLKPQKDIQNEGEQQDMDNEDIEQKQNKLLIGENLNRDKKQKAEQLCHKQVSFNDGQDSKNDYEVQQSEQKKENYPKQGILKKQLLGSDLSMRKMGSQLVEHIKESSDLSMSNLKSVHPAIQEIILKFSQDKIIGSSIRCQAFLHALQKVVMEFKISGADIFAKKLKASLDKTIETIEQYRSLSEGMQTAYKFCKHLIMILDRNCQHISVQKQKEWFCKQINNFIQQKIIQADDLIIQKGLEYLKNEDFIMVFARSQVVENLLIKAHNDDKKFTVIVVDNPPFYEGKETLKRLSKHGIECIYTLLSHSAYFIKKVSAIYVGASSMLSNGSLVSRIGTGLLSCLAKDYRKPFHVFCETYKFSEKSQLDSLSRNEMAKNFINNSILPLQKSGSITSSSGQLGSSQQSLASSSSCSQASYKNQQQNTVTNAPLTSKASPIDFNPINLRYDLTPCENISIVMTELGPLPPTSIPHVIREFKKLEYIGRIDLPTEE